MSDQPIPKLDTLDHVQMRVIIKRAVAWLASAQEDNGHFRYEYLPFEDKYLDDDNIVRQAGALYALGEVAKRDSHNTYADILKPAIVRSIDYFETISNEATYNGHHFRAVCSNPDKRKHKLGATSLVLCGILAAAERYPDIGDDLVDLISDYKEFIVAMKKDGAGFIGAYKLYRKVQKPQNDKESSYSNGEAMLALARYRRYAEARGILQKNDPSETITKELFDYINSSAVPFDSALYLWAMAAIKDLATYDPQHLSLHLDYTKRYTDWRIKSVRGKKTSKHNYASAVEGMISAQSLLRSASEYEAYMSSLNQEIEFWLAHTSQMQLLHSNHKVNGGFLTGLNEPSQRIDFTQHALMAYIQKLSDIDGQSL